MHQNLDVMQTALRVLTALSQKKDPDPRDVIALSESTGPLPDGMSLDEFACTAIQKAIEKRAADRRRNF